MGLYNFEPRFVEFIRSGRKKHTIRGVRRYPDKPGNTLHLYIGLRTRSVELIGRAVCSALDEITILGDDRNRASGPFRVIVNAEELAPDEREALAFRDGFESFFEMTQFWVGCLPFTGHIIHWGGLQLP